MKSCLLPKQLNRKIGRALHDYRMLEDGDTVLIAVSGGVDSLVAAWVLQMWRRKAPIAYAIEAVHVDNGVWGSERAAPAPVDSIREQLDRFSIPLTVLAAWPLPEESEPDCYVCARNRRTQLFDFARKRGFSKLALGHHKDDLLETFFINLLYSGNVSTMVPRQDLFDGKLSLIRILAYLEKHDIIALANQIGLRPVKNLCPMSGETQRDRLRVLLDRIYRDIPGAKGSIFSALGNVREDYML